VQVIVGWLAVLVTDGGLFVLARRVARMPETTAPDRQFWRIAALAAVCFAVGDSHQVVQTLLHPAVDTMAFGVVQSVTMLTGTAAVVGAAVFYPTGLGSGGARPASCWTRRPP
jgi:hypothetical protein